MSNTKVVKFGGSSLADAKQFRKVRDIIFADKTRRFVVPSAPGKRSYTDEKVTDMLYQCQKFASEKKAFADVFDHITERYLDIAQELSLKIDLLPYLEIVRNDIQKGASADYAASRGEYLNGLLLADFLGFDFIDAAEVIVFDKEGALDADKTQIVMGERLQKHQNAVIPGFYGAMPNGQVKTFSRGGSDISGAIVARACEAEVYENWTDVSGMLMADPRVVQNPLPIRVITYTELRELSYMGATVLHDEAIFPVRQACIPINVKNTNEPSEPGTMIVPEVDETNKNTITGVAGRKGFTVIAMEKDKMNTQVGFAADILGVLRAYGVSVEHMPTGIDTLSVVVETKMLEGKRQQVLDAIMETCEPDFLEVHENMALLAVVGHGMTNRVGTSAKVFSALAENDVNVRMIDQGSSEMNIIIGVENAELEAAVNAIYHAFDKA